MSDLMDRIQTATRTAMKARDKRLVAALRLVNAELKRVEVDERKALADADVITVLTRMVKQRNDSRSQYEAAGRTDLAEQEAFEIDVVRSFMPHAAQRGGGGRTDRRRRRRHRRGRHAGHGQGDGAVEGRSGRPGRHGRSQRQGEGQAQRLIGSYCA